MLATVNGSVPLRAAMVAYYYPPIGGGGTARSAGFVQWLPSCGVEPTVYSVMPESAAASREFQLDPTLEATHGSAQIVRVSAPKRFDRLRKRIKQSRFYPIYWAVAYRWEYEGHRPWAKAVANAVIRDHQIKPFDLIYVSAAPNSSVELAVKAARQCSIPLIVDLRDPWNVPPLKHYPSGFHYRWEKRLEEKLLRRADAVIMNSPGACQVMRDWLGADMEKRITWIPNGFDSLEDSRKPMERAPGNFFTLVHTGTLYAPGSRFSRAGRYYANPIDDDARSLVPLAKGIRVLFDRRPELSERLRVIQVGFAPDALVKAVRTIVPEPNVIDFAGLRSKSEANEMMNTADALLVVQVAWADHDEDVPHIPGKVYDYLKTRKPIFAPVPKGDLYRLLSKSDVATVVDFWSSTAIAADLERLIDAKGASTAPRKLPSYDFDLFSRARLTQRLAKLMRQVSVREELHDIAPPVF